MFCLSFSRAHSFCSRNTRRCCKITRYFRKIETDDEKEAGEREWASVTGLPAAQTTAEQDDTEAEPPEPSTATRVLVLLILVLAVWLPEIFVAGAAVVLLFTLRGSSALRRFVVDSEWAKAAQAQRDKARAKHSADRQPFVHLNAS